MKIFIKGMITGFFLCLSVIVLVGATKPSNSIEQKKLIKKLEDIEQKIDFNYNVLNKHLVRIMAYGVKVKEGDKSRLQAYEGVEIAIKNRGINSAFTVRKISSGVGVERVFQTHSPMVDSIEIKRRGDVRQAKLYYLRERSGRSARIKEKLNKK